MTGKYHSSVESPSVDGEERTVAGLSRGKAALAVLALITLVAWLVLNRSDRWQTLEVTASAYNSLAGQTTQLKPDIAAWGDRLEPGMKAIAVSRDLLDLGFDRGTTVTIDGLPGEWRVLDKMHRRWTQHIDIYMGHDVEAARSWGRKKVTIRWQTGDRDET